MQHAPEPSDALRRALQALAGVVAVTGSLSAFRGVAGLPGEVEADATAASELRFMTTSWLGWGAVAWWTSRDVERRLDLVPPFAGVLAGGALQRVLTWRTHGAPHPFFRAGIVGEAASAAILLALHARVRRAAA